MIRRSSLRLWTWLVLTGACSLLQAQTPPYVVGAFPRDGAVNISCNSFVTVSVFFPDESRTLDPATLRDTAIRLTVADRPDRRVPGQLSFHAESRSIHFRPLEALEPETTYQFEVNDQLTDARGFGFRVYRSTFTTGTCRTLRPVVVSNARQAAPSLVSGFVMVPEGDSVILSWHTPRQLREGDFTLERSGDGVNFDMLGHLPTVEDAMPGEAYTWVDTRPAPGWNHYRLVVYDPSGEVVCPDTLSWFWEVVKFRRHEIPREGVLPVAFYVQRATPMAFELQDASGKAVRRKAGMVQPGNRQVDISLDGLAPGVYLAILRASQVTLTEKIRILP
ncbi:MAG: Ig-like domain-containing protein [Bacteroidia bacterium]|nr:Ig-like domain-containing protein [Bacteroidia bacterium]